MLPVAAEAAQRTAVLGFADGSVRLVRRCSDGWRLLAATRPHKVTATITTVRQPTHRDWHEPQCTAAQHVNTSVLTVNCNAVVIYPPPP